MGTHIPITYPSNPYPNFSHGTRSGFVSPFKNLELRTTGRVFLLHWDKPPRLQISIILSTFMFVFFGGRFAFSIIHYSPFPPFLLSEV